MNRKKAEILFSKSINFREMIYIFTTVEFERLLIIIAAQA